MKQLRDVINEPLLRDGESLSEASQRKKLFILFLRHSGCTFCRETLSKVSKLKAELESNGYEIVLVHMQKDENAKSFFSKYSLENVQRISDPERIIYNAFGLERGTLMQVIGPKSFFYGIFKGTFLKHGFGYPEGDVYQMPGSFVLSKGEIIRSHAPCASADEASFDSCFL